MNGIINLLKTLYSSNKKLFVVSLLIVAVLVIAGCTTGQGGAPPSGPIGGGCS